MVVGPDDVLPPIPMRDRDPSDDDEPPLPATPAPGAGAPVCHGRTAATAVVYYGSHKISFYETDGRFEAVCKDPTHLPIGRYRLTRSVPTDMDALTTAKGRPLGLLMAWLTDDSDRSVCVSRPEHCNPFYILGLGHDTRAAGRELLKTLPNADALLAHERPQRHGEGEEPLGDP